MVDFSALNPFRQGQSALQDARQPLGKNNPDAGDSAAQARPDTRAHGSGCLVRRCACRT